MCILLLLVINFCFGFILYTVDASTLALNVQVEIARAKAALSYTMRQRLREVSKLQTYIRKIQKQQELVRMAWGQKAS